MKPYLDTPQLAAGSAVGFISYFPLNMRQLETAIGLDALTKLAGESFGDFVKAVVDIERRIMAIDAELHADLEALLLESGSRQTDLWGINLYPALGEPDFVEFDSMINLRPSQGNLTRGVDSPQIQQQILAVVNQWIKR